MANTLNPKPPTQHQVVDAIEAFPESEEVLRELHRFLGPTFSSSLLLSSLELSDTKVYEP